MLFFNTAIQIHLPFTFPSLGRLKLKNSLDYIAVPCLNSLQGGSGKSGLRIIITMHSIHV